MKITIIEDEINLSEKLSKKLRKNWYNTSIFNNKNELLKNHKIESDLYIIDLNLWKSENEWFEIIKWLREWKNINSPIIITSWYSDIEKKVFWLDNWADDYLSKPYHYDELLARVRKLIRNIWNIKSNIIKHNNLEYDLKQWIIVSEKHKNIHFSKKELMIIEFFLINKNKLINRNSLIISIWWSYDWIWISDNTINVTLCNLRQKIWDEIKIETLVWKWFILKD